MKEKCVKYNSRTIDRKSLAAKWIGKKSVLKTRRSLHCFSKRPSFSGANWKSQLIIRTLRSSCTWSSAEKCPRCSSTVTVIFSLSTSCQSSSSSTSKSSSSLEYCKSSSKLDREFPSSGKSVGDIRAASEPTSINSWDVGSLNFRGRPRFRFPVTGLIWESVNLEPSSNSPYDVPNDSTSAFNMKRWQQCKSTKLHK